MPSTPVQNQPSRFYPNIKNSHCVKYRVYHVEISYLEAAKLTLY